MNKHFFRSETTEIFLFDTAIENIFISEYMPTAPQEYVKVYLYALMYANSDYFLDNEALAKHLSMQVEDVLKAWSYWEQRGIIVKHYEDLSNKFVYSVEFLSLREQMFAGKKVPQKENFNALSNSQLASLVKNIEKIINRPLSSSEIQAITSPIDDMGVSVELVSHCFAYCKGKGHTEIKFALATLRKWTDSGIKTVNEADEYLSQLDQRYFVYKRVMKALGFHRTPTEEEQRKIDIWIDELGYDMDKILEACAKTSGIASPNVNYVHRILENWAGVKTRNDESGSDKASKPKKITASDVNKYYEYLRKEAEKNAQKCKQEVYEALPRVLEIDEEMQALEIKRTQLMLAKTADSILQMDKIKKNLGNLLAEKAYLMAEANFDLEYMDIKYKCNKCKDTGIDENSMRCECYQERLREADLWQNTDRNI